MGTNFYLFTKDKEICELKNLRTELTDIPEFGYTVHIAKTSGGWLPLFQGHQGLKSVKQLKEIYDTQKFKILDEYDKEFSWDTFKERVIDWNGGYDGAIPKEPYFPDDNLGWQGLPNHLPISHLEVISQYKTSYFKDDEGYEFTMMDFS